MCGLELGLTCCNELATPGNGAYSGSGEIEGSHGAGGRAGT